MTETAVMLPLLSLYSVTCSGESVTTGHKAVILLGLCKLLIYQAAITVLSLHIYSLKLMK